jgi:hypothetical protein
MKTIFVIQIVQLGQYKDFYPYLHNAIQYTTNQTSVVVVVIVVVVL